MRVFVCKSIDLVSCITIQIIGKRPEIFLFLSFPDPQNLFLKEYKLDFYQDLNR